MIDILNAREERYIQILDLINKKIGTVLCGKINYPGSNKNTKEAKYAFKILNDILLNEFKDYIILQKVLGGKDGDSLILILKLDKIKAKKMAIEIEENHILGRIFDIDVYDEYGVPISRTEFSSKERRCIICNLSVRECIIKKTHTVDEVKNFIDITINKFGEENVR